MVDSEDLFFSVNKMLGDLDDQKWALRMICFVTFFAGLIVFIVIESYKPLSRMRYESSKKEQFRNSLVLIFDKVVFKSIGSILIMVFNLSTRVYSYAL